MVALIFFLLVALVVFRAARNKLPQRQFVKLGSSVWRNRKNSLPTTNVNKDRSNNDISALSLWLLPPAPYHLELREMIVRLSQDNDGVQFDPHVTVASGIMCQNTEQAERIVRSLRDGFHLFGEIPCEFYEKPRRCKEGVCTSDDSPSEGTQPYVWNQAFVVEMKIGARFMNLCQLAHKILEIPLKGGNNRNECTFPQPLGRPHMSLFYGEQTVPGNDQVKPVPKFNATQLALWNTSPPTLDGVQYWKQIAVIDLVRP
jgi:hypothetical protein